MKFSKLTSACAASRRPGLKAVVLGAALTIGAAFSAQADDTGSPFRFLLGQGLTYGGDSLIHVPFRDGSERVFKAGGLVQFYGGAEYRLSDTLALQATVGYHLNYAKASSDGSVRFTRIPVDLLVVNSLTNNIRIGGGAELVGRPELKGSGLASNVSQTYDSTVGAIVEGEYLFTPHIGVQLRYVSEKFKPSDGSSSVDGSHAGLLFNYYF